MTDLNKLRSEFEAIPEIKAHLDHGNVFWSDKNQTYASEFQCLHVVACYVNGAWFMFQEKSKAQAVPEAHTHSVTLTCAELKEAYDFGAPDGEKDQFQMETEMLIKWLDDGYDGAGYYCWYADLPEEGCIKLGESESGAEG
ncbi:hypothetical protein [Leifsonia sp. NPDC077715]|uniref:hypothetical protein n=1 Tax=Leifsonia sp. NPDC077715 TaxID=3155539 RepID=UPI003423435D